MDASDVGGASFSREMWCTSEVFANKLLLAIADAVEAGDFGHGVDRGMWN